MQTDVQLLRKRPVPALGNMHGAAHRRAPDPLQVEETPGERRPQRSCYMVAPLAPVDMMRRNQRPTSLEERAVEAEIEEPAPVAPSSSASCSHCCLCAGSERKPDEG